MTSPSLKRQLDFEIPQQDSNHMSTTPNSGGVGAGAGGGGVGGGSEQNSSTLANGNKRRCTTNPTSHYVSATNNQNVSMNQQHQQQAITNLSPFKELPNLLDTLNEDVNRLINDELQKVHENHPVKHEPPILTACQTQSICEKLIREKEQRIRDEYDRILACKLAEQYDLFTKANYLNSYHATSRHHMHPNPSAPTVLQAQNHHQAVANHQSINALAAAFSSMQRSAAAAAVSVPNSTSVAGAATPTNTTNPGSIPDLTTLAATLSANGHPGAITTQLAFNLQQQAAAAAAIQQVAQQQRGPTNGSNIPSGPVLLSSNLDEQLATPEALFTLFGVFGDVIRVKILFNKKDNALIQMADANQAQVAQGYLDKQKIFGKVIRVTRSKHQLVQMPREGNQSDAGLTKDFTNSPLHRFKIPGSRNYLNIYPPSNTLHISNIPATIDEKDLNLAFKEQCGFEFSSFKFFPKDRKMALMKFSSIEQATIALIKMHNYQINDENNLRVSFSKSVMQQ